MSEEEKSSSSKEDKEEAPVSNAVPPKKGKKMIIIIIIIIILLIAIGGGAYFFMLKKSAHDTKNETNVTSQEHEKKEEHVKEPPPAHGSEQGKSAEGASSEGTVPVSLYKNLEDFLVDLKASGTASFIKINVTLKVDQEATLKIVEERLPVIRDSFITYLRELKTDDLYGSRGLFILKQELLMRVNKIVAPGTIEEIYIQNILTR